MKKRVFMDRIIFFAILLFSAITFMPLLFIFAYIFKKGLSFISLSFLFSLPKPVGETGGGIFNAIVGTAIITLIASFIAVPVGVGAGIYLSEKKEGFFVQAIKTCTDIIQGIPSIVLGIIAYIWIVKPMGGFSAFSGSVALAIMMLPAITYSTEETLKMVPESLKEAAYALGVPYYKVILKVVVPAGISGIITGILISAGRIAGETAPLLFTAFGSPHLNLNPFKPMASIPLLIFNYALSPYPEWINQAWAASAVLCIMVFIINIFARIFAERWKILL